MTTRQFMSFANKFCEKLRELAPYDTGNLANNAIQLHFEDEKTAVIQVNESIAPYMPYTNEPWISPKWNGKKNPNEKWFDNAVMIICTELAEEYGGNFTI